MINFLVKNKNTETNLSRFFREASSRDKKKVFKKVIREATEDQRKILDKGMIMSVQ